LNNDKIDEKAFMEELMQSARTQEAITFYAYENKRFNLLVSVFPATDLAAHMMYRLTDRLHPRYDAVLAAGFGNAIRRTYIHMDRVVGRMLDLIDENTVLFAISTHGFRPSRYTVNLNTWLVEHGYMTLKETQDKSAPRSLQQLASGQSFFDQVDWSTTKAYSLGLGQIYINLRGREPEGIVEPSDYVSLCNDIRTSLLSLTDNRESHSGEAVVRRVGIRNEVWKGPFVESETDAPDIQVGFEDGYHVGWECSLGGIQREVIENNTERWSGDHSCVSPDLVPGVILCSRPIKAATPSILDLAPTVLASFNLPIPPSMEGKSLLEPTSR
jgi:predicted AlkP superfamily phosphohydrolase/phosphomutase